MGRNVRIEYHGAIYHAVNRGELPLGGIAERLHMGSRGHLAWLLERGGTGCLAVCTRQCLLGI